MVWHPDRAGTVPSWRAGQTLTAQSENSVSCRKRTQLWLSSNKAPSPEHERLGASFVVANEHHNLTQEHLDLLDPKVVRRIIAAIAVFFAGGDEPVRQSERFETAFEPSRCA